MFICESCGEQQPCYEKPTKRVVETRHKVYTEKDRGDVGEGDEIVRELSVCGICAVKSEVTPFVPKKVEVKRTRRKKADVAAA